MDINDHKGFVGYGATGEREGVDFFTFYIFGGRKVVGILGPSGRAGGQARWQERAGDGPEAPSPPAHGIQQGGGEAATERCIYVCAGICVRRCVLSCLSTSNQSGQRRRSQGARARGGVDGSQATTSEDADASRQNKSKQKECKTNSVVGRTDGRLKRGAKR